MAGDYQRELRAAYRMAYNRLLWEGWEGELEEEISESPEINRVHERYRTPTPTLTPEEQQRVDTKVQKLLSELL